MPNTTGNGEDDGEDDHADAAAEQGLAVDDGLEAWRKPNLTQDCQRGDWVGGRDRGAKDQGEDQTDPDTEYTQRP